MNPIKQYLAKIGAKGGSANTEAQNEARARNAKIGVGLGGWPKGKKRGKKGLT